MRKIDSIELLIVSNKPKPQTQGGIELTYPFNVAWSASQRIARNPVVDTSRWKMYHVPASQFKGEIFKNEPIIRRLPTLFFAEIVDGERSIVLTRLEGNLITADQIYNTLLTLGQLTKDGTGKYWRKDGQPWFPVDVGVNYACKYLGICDMPDWMWMMYGLGSGVMALNSKSTLPKVVFGSISIYALYRYSQ